MLTTLTLKIKHSFSTFNDITNITIITIDQGCYLTNISGAQKGKRQKVRSPTDNVLGAAAKMQKNLGAQRTFLGAPGCWAPVRQQPCY